MSIADAVARASAYLGEHPDEARYRDSAAIARLTTGLRVEVSGAGGEHLVTDMPAAIGGGGTAPSPGWLLRSAVASCVASLVAIRAAGAGLAIGAIEVSVDSESDDRGILGLDPSIPAGPLSMAVVVTVEPGDADPGAIAGLIDWAVRHCPVSDAVGRAVPIDVTLRDPGRDDGDRSA